MSSPRLVVIVTGDAKFGAALSVQLAHAFEVKVLPPAASDTDIPQGQVSLLVHDGTDGLMSSRLLERAEERLLVLGPNNPEAMIVAIEAGAVGYVDRSAPLVAIFDAIQLVNEGKAVIPPFMLGSLLKHVVRRRRLGAESLEKLDLLTAREREVFELAALGMSHGEVANRLFISPATSRTHLHRIFKKLEVHSGAELVAFAAACGVPTTEES